jgi:hypothetical protein
MLSRCWQTALLGLLLLLPVPAMDQQPDQQPFMSPGSAEDLDSQREAARERTRALAEEEGRCHIPHLHSSRSQQNIVLWI